MCRSRQELSNVYLLANFGFDTAKNEPCKSLPNSPALAERSRRVPGLRLSQSPSTLETIPSERYRDAFTGDDRSVKIKSLEAAKIMKTKWLVLGCIEADFCK